MPYAQEFFKTLVISRMKQEAKKLGVDLKPYYADQAEFYNSAQFEGEAYLPICSPLQSPLKQIVEQAHFTSSKHTQTALLLLTGNMENGQSSNEVEVIQIVIPDAAAPLISSSNLTALEDKFIGQVQTKLDSLKAQIDTD